MNGLLPSDARLDFFRYEIPFAQPLRIGTETLSTRKGFLARCKMGGVQGWGDIAPLPGYSIESIDQVEQLLRGGLQADTSNLPPSVRSGIDFAVRNCQAHYAGLTLYALLGGQESESSVQTARLITDDEGQAVLSARNRFPVVKIKVGRRAIDEDIARVNGIIEELDPGQKVRLDANRAWSIDEYVRFARSIDMARIEFFEEPLAKLADYRAQAGQLEIPFALDESLASFDIHELDSFSCLAAIVVKPTMTGSISDCARYFDWARTRQKQLVISSAYESGIGMRNLIALAGALGGNSVAGLDTYSRLAGDIVSPHLSLHGGAYLVADTFSHAWQVNLDQLGKI